MVQAQLHSHMEKKMGYQLTMTTNYKLIKQFKHSKKKETTKVLGGPKGSFGFFRKMALVALSCL